MNTPTHLLARLDAIAAAFSRFEGALALLGMGSAGHERERLDAYSDLDFFAVVEDRFNRRFVEDLDWLEQVHPVAFKFRNTADGYKILFSDGIFCEMAVFIPAELARIPRPTARIVWSAPGFDPALATPAQTPPVDHTADWHLGEALTNLYVGLARYLRGEKLSAMRFIQQYALDRVIDLVDLHSPSQTTASDPFARERRVEQRQPELAVLLSQLAPGYEQTPAAAAEILEFLTGRYPVNDALVKEIRHLLDKARLS